MPRSVQFLAILVIIGVLLPACQNGKSSSSQGPSLPSKTVSWDPPQYFTDNIPLLPSKDLQGFEIYVRQDPSFGLADSSVAIASPVDTSFDLATLDPPLSRGVTYYVSVRAVTTEGVKSDFSASASFSFPK